MVQNTVGRIYLDNNPYETQLQKKWQYLVEPSEKPSADSILKYDELTDLRVADLACGSGHILNECFDLLYDLYIAEGYGRGEAIENIFRHNLTGVDLDTRAKQLATFSLLLKACQKDNAFADAHCLPNVLDMTGIVPDMNEQELSDACLRFIGGYENVAGEMLEQDFELLRDADNLGSIMKFNDDEDYLAMLRYHYEDWTDGGIDDCPEEIKAFIPGVRLILALTEKYHALVMNPPYMGSGNMNVTLSKYVKDEYEEGKADLFSVFMLLAIDRLLPNGKYGMINMQSWMFLSSFENSALVCSQRTALIICSILVLVPSMNCRAKWCRILPSWLRIAKARMPQAHTIAWWMGRTVETRKGCSWKRKRTVARQL